METRVLGRTGLQVSVLGLGAAYIGLPSPEEPRDEAEVRRGKETLWAAVESGCRLIDSAAGYGRGGSERLIAAAFGERPDLAADVLVTTKVGKVPFAHDGTYDMAMRSIEGSMERLRVERFPLLYIHDPMDMPMDLVMGERGTLGALRSSPAPAVRRKRGPTRRRYSNGYRRRSGTRRGHCSGTGRPASTACRPRTSRRPSP